MRTHLLATSGVAALLAAMPAHAQTMTGGVSKRRLRPPPRRLAAVLILAILSVPGAAGPAQAQSITFSGNFNNFVSTPQVLPLPNVTPAFTANASNGGPNVTIVAPNGINVGDSALGTVLVEGGAQLNVLGVNQHGCIDPAQSCIGTQTTGVGEVTVTGPGSAFLLPGTFAVGENGTGSLTIADGGRVTDNNGTMLVGLGAGAGRVTVNGATSTLFVAGSLVLGQGQGSTGTLIIENGANVTNNQSFVAGGFNTAGLGTSTVIIRTGGVLTSNSFATIGTTPPRDRHGGGGSRLRLDSGD